MHNLDTEKLLTNWDQENMVDSIRDLPKQCLHAWEDAYKVVVPDTYKDVNKLVMTGMGGSILGARLIESVFFKQLKVPLFKVNGYDLPGFMDENTLVICSSYSGTTEETLENARQAMARKTKWMAVTTGGGLLSLAIEAGVPYYQIDPRYNTSKQPRMALGYSVIGQLALINKAGLLSIKDSQINELADFMNQMQRELGTEVLIKDNPAKKLAQQIHGKGIIVIAAEHLAGAGHTVKNQFNESAKNFAARFDIPELNHHLLEGLQFPTSNKTDLVFWLIESDLYNKKIQERIKITKNVIEMQNMDTVVWKAESPTPLSQAFELLQFGSYIAYYLVYLNQVNPNLIPWVDFFKGELKKELLA